MPPESLPCNRKDFFKERKHEKSDSVGSIARWKDSHHGSREFGRWGSDVFRRPTGHGKQGGYQLFSKESGHGCTPSWERASTAGDESNLRPSATRGDGKHGRNNREIKDLKRHHCEVADASAGQHEISAQRSVSDLLSYISNTHSDIENSSWDPLHFKEQHNKMGGMDGLAAGHRFNTEQSVGTNVWMPMKWNRSSSFSSRGSGLSHSSSTRSSDETKFDLQSGRATPLQSPSGDAVGGVTSSPQFEETCPRKKQRLGWGQGLAKYEKGKVEGSDETVSKNGQAPSVKMADMCQSIIPSLPDKSPRVTGILECASPATTSSFACSSSPGLDDNLPFKGATNDIGTSNLSGSPGQWFQSCLEEFSFNLEHLELNSVTNLSAVLTDLLQLEDACSGDSNFVKSTATNRLLLLKSEFSKAIEKIECEIDLFENEVKLLNSEPEINGSCPTAFDSLQVEHASKSQEVGSVPKVLQKPVPLQLVSSGDALEEVCGEVKDDDIDSPGTATSKFVEHLSMEKGVSMPYKGKHDVCSAYVVPGSSKSSEQQPPIGEKNSECVSASGGGNHLNESSTSAHVSSDVGEPIKAECELNILILASNRDYARKSYEVFNKLLPANQSQIDIWGTANISCQQSNTLVKEKLAMRKCSLRFKERILTLKYRAFQHLWKEDLRLLSVRKHRAKSQKRFELCSRTSLNGYQKNRSSIRSRFNSPAGKLTLVPTTEIADFTSKLLLDSGTKLYRNNLKMPALILPEERNLSRFVTSNGLVEDPCAVEKERMIINQWMPKEKEVFLEMLATYGKDFKKIASFLDHKTTADCIEFYYKNHKSESFEKIKKKSELRKQERGLFPTNTYLVTSGKKWNREVNAVSLDILQEASVIAARTDDSMKTQQTCVGKSLLGEHSGYKTYWGDDALNEKSSNVDIIGNEREAVAADTLASICGAFSSEAMSSCITSSVEPGEGCQEWKFQRRNFVIDQPLTPEVMQNVDDEETCSDESCGEVDSVDWTDDEKSSFIVALRSYGRDFAKISQCIGTKSRVQCKIFFSKARKCLGLDVIYPWSGYDSAPVSDANGGRSDAEDTCVLEMGSAICSTQSCSKKDVDFLLSATNANCEVLRHSGTTPHSLPMLNTNCEASDHSGTTHLQTEPDISGGRGVKEPLHHEDAEMGSAICSTQSCSKKDVDFPLSATNANCEVLRYSGTTSHPLPMLNTNCEASDHSGTTHLQTEPDISGGRGVKEPLHHEDAEIPTVTSVLADSMEGLKLDFGCDDDNSLVEEVMGKFVASPMVVQYNDEVTTDTLQVCDLPVPCDKNADEIDVAKEEAGPTVTLVEESLCARGPSRISHSMSNAAAELNTLSDACDEGLKAELEQHENLVPESGYDGRQDVKTILDASNSRSSSCCFVQDSITNRNASHPSSERGVLPSFSIDPNNQPQISVELLPSVKKAQIISWQQENCPVTANLVSQDSSAIHYEGHLRQVTSSSMLTFEEPKNNQRQKLASADSYKQHLTCHSNQSSQILKGYPLHELNKKDRNGEDLISCDRHEIFQSNQFFLQNFYHEKYNGSKPPHTVAALPLLSRCQEQSSLSHWKSHSQCSSVTEDHSCRIGDVKLFGQILSHPSTSQKTFPTTRERDNNVSCLPKSSSKSVKFTTGHGIDRALGESKRDAKNHSSLEEFPKRTYGFWDGNRIQTGLSSLPDSAILLAKYPAAFRDHIAPSRRNLQSLPAVIKRNDRNTGCVSVFPSKDLSGSGDLTDYQLYRSYDRTKVQPFIVGAKPAETLSELQKQNAFEASSFQQQARGVVGMNVMGSGILVGGGTGVSDPVAAIKMHYAATEQYRGQAGSIREEDIDR